MKMITQTQLLEILRKACDNAGGQNKWAELNGISKGYVSDVLKGNRAPGGKILRALTYESVNGYKVMTAATTKGGDCRDQSSPIEPNDKAFAVTKLTD